MTEPQQSTVASLEPDAARAGATVLINARIVDPASRRDELGGLLIEGGVIADVGEHLRRNAPRGAEVIDCGGKILAPGLIDMQVATGEPGDEHRETLATASRAAAAGGVTTMVVTPDTEPVIDDVSLVDFIQRRARDTALVHVLPTAALTKNLAGKEMAEIGLLLDAGAIAFSNGMTSIANAMVMRRLLTYTRDFNALVIHHVEDPDLASSGVMNAGPVASRLGLPGVHTAAETIMLERDVRLVEWTRGRYHAALISCEASLKVMRRAKKRGLPVTCGVSINSLALNENDIGPYRTFFKLRPPLRSEDERRAMIEGIASGTIDVIVSAHNPQDVDAKRRPFEEASDGAIGLETMLAAALRLVHADELTLAEVLAPMTSRPAEILGLDSGCITQGAPADLIVIDPDVPWVVDPDQLQSRSKNTAFDEARLTGRCVRTIVAGRTVHAL
ncbi:MAG: dihydroorotase [Pseudomonadota bacterium]